MPFSEASSVPRVALGTGQQGAGAEGLRTQQPLPQRGWVGRGAAPCRWLSLAGEQQSTPLCSQAAKKLPKKQAQLNSPLGVGGGQKKRSLAQPSLSFQRGQEGRRTPPQLTSLPETVPLLLPSHTQPPLACHCQNQPLVSLGYQFDGNRTAALQNLPQWQHHTFFAEVIGGSQNKPFPSFMLEAGSLDGPRRSELKRCLPRPNR